MKKLLLLAFLMLCFAEKAEARQEWYGFCQAKNSSTRVASCTVEVFLTGTNTDATLYSDNIGTLMGNPFTVPSSGIITFYADNGRYDVRLSGGNPSISPAYTIPDQLLEDFSLAAPDGSSLFSLNGSIGGITIGGTYIGVDNSTTPTQFSLPLPLVTNSQITSTLATGTAPFNVASTTLVTNLNAEFLQGVSWANPSSIGSGTPSSGVFTSLTSASANPAIGAFLNLANADNVCWRNSGNTLNECMSEIGDVFQFNGHSVAFLDVSQNWTGTQNFSNITWTSGGLNAGIFSHSNTGSRTYTFPDNTGTIAELNLAQSWSATQTLSGLVLGTSSTLTGVSGNAPLLLSSGVNSGVTGAVLCNDANSNATTASCTLPINGPFARSTTVTTSTITTSSPVTVMSVSVTIPAVGGPFRILSLPDIIVKANADNSGADCWTNDGTNNWNFFEIYAFTMNNNTYSYSQGKLSPVTYAAGAGAKTITLLCQANHTATMSVVSGTVGPAVPSLSVEVVASN